MSAGVIASHYVAAVISSAFDAEVLADSPTLFLRHAEASGTIMTDRSGLAHHGTYTGSPTLGVAGIITGDSSTAMSLPGNAAVYGEVANAAWMNTSTLTFEKVIKPSVVTAYQHLVDRDSAGTDGHWLRINSNGTVQMSVRTAAGATAANTTDVLVAGTKYVLAGTYDGTAVKVFINGVQKASVPLTGALLTPARPISVGRNGGGIFPYNGVDAATVVFGTALSPTRLAAHAAAA